MEDKPPYGHNEKVCPICKKVFIPCPYHIFKVNNKMFCSYGCRNRYFEEHPKKDYNYVKKWGK